MNRLPIARTENIVVQKAGSDLLIYDLVSHKAYSLNETSRIVFEACDGRTSFDTLIQNHAFTDDLIYLTLDMLRDEKLIQSRPDYHFDRLSRRAVIRRIGLSSLVALPMIASIIAPRAAAALSGAPTCVPFNNPCVVGGTACCPRACPSGGTLPAACVGGTCQTFQGCPF